MEDEKFFVKLFEKSLMMLANLVFRVLEVEGSFSAGNFLIIN